MDPIPKSGLYYPNKIVRIAILAIEEVMGKNGLNAILRLANLPHLIDNYPPNNLEREFDFSDFSSINGALEEMYGPRGGRGLALRAGRATFTNALRNFGALVGVGDLAFKVLPLSAKLRIGAPAMARIFTQTSDQLSTVEDKDDHLLYIIHKCPICWGRKTDKPACFIASGLIIEGLKWVSGGKDFKVVQSTARSVGDPTCDFVITKEPIS
ncbi:MAG: 4-vinyl reductase [Anaerolineaceae bacterium]|nr:4-vinyl reductase [Anaerolineaceae bacterium]